MNIDDQMAGELFQGGADGFNFGEVVQEEAEEIAADSSEYSSSEGGTESNGSEYETGSESEEEDARPNPPPRPTEKFNGLRPSKSMTFPRSAPVSRKNFDLPPLPPLPPGVHPPHRKSSTTGGSATVMRSKTSFGGHDSSRLRRRPSDSALHIQPSTSHNAMQPAKSRTKKPTTSINYPELTAIPQLLPLFVELVRPQLYNHRNLHDHGNLTE